MENLVLAATLGLWGFCCHFTGKTAQQKGFGYGAGFLACLFFTLLGMLLIYLIPARENSEEAMLGKVRCPECDEPISAKAKICKHCQAPIDRKALLNRPRVAATAARPAGNPKAAVYMIGSGAGLAVMLLVGYGVMVNMETRKSIEDISRKARRGEISLAEYKMVMSKTGHLTDSEVRKVIAELEAREAQWERDRQNAIKLQREDAARQQREGYARRNTLADGDPQDAKAAEAARQEQARRAKVEQEAAEVYRKELERLKKEKGLE